MIHGGKSLTLSIIIPCYNEAHTIDTIIGLVEGAILPSGWRKEIIIVDDGSSDGTREHVLKYSNRHKVIVRENGGKGAAVKTGLRAVTGEFVLIQDADMEYDPSDYQILVSAIQNERSVVFGSRLLRKNDYFNIVYLYGSKALTVLFNIVFGSRFTDITTCYKLFPRSVIGNLLQWKEDGFVFDAIYLTYELHRFNNQSVEVPIHYYPRGVAEGKKVHWRDGVWALFAMLRVLLTKNGLTTAMENYQQFIRYVSVGGVVYTISLVSLYAYTEVAGIYYLLSSVFAFLTAFVASFFLQRAWTFQKTTSERISYHALQYLSLQLVNLCANTTLMYVFVEYFNLWYLMAQAIISLGLAGFTYVVAKWYIFTEA